MESVIEHMLEPGVAMPAPRRTRLPLRVSLLLAVAMLLLGIFVAGSGRALWEAVKLTWVAQAGRTVSGQIVQIKTEPNTEKNQPLHQIAVRYACDLPLAQGLHHQEGWIGLGEEPASSNSPTLGGGPMSPKPASASSARAFHLGQAFPIRYANWFGQTLSYPWQPNPNGRVLTLLFAGSLVLLVSLLLLRRLLRWTRERLHLLRLGTATVGTITHKRSEAEDMVRYFLRYGYSSGQAEGREHEEQVSSDQWKLFHVGQPVTVLYDPAAPERVGLYALIC